MTHATTQCDLPSRLNVEITIDTSVITDQTAVDAQALLGAAAYHAAQRAIQEHDKG